MFYQHYLGNNKPTFLVCNPAQVYAAILEFSRSFRSFSEPLKLLSPDSSNFLRMVSVWLQSA